MKSILSLLFVSFLCCFIGCKKLEPQKQIPIAKDIKRLEAYNKLDNLKEGIWHVDEWKALASKICENTKYKDCSVLGEIYHENFYGFGTKKDRHKAIQMLAKSCSMNDSMSCLKLATLADKSDYPVGKSTDLFKKSHDIAIDRCSKDYAMDCYVLALIYFEGYAPFDRDRQKSKEYANKSCDMKHAGSCIFLGINGDTYEDIQQARQKACKLGIAEYCK